MSLTQLPSELLHHVLSYLGPIDLASTAETCRTLHSVAADDRLWAAEFRRLKVFAPDQPFRPDPYSTWRSLYAAHYPYWFVPAQRIWFADKAAHGDPMVGQIVLALYDPTDCCIKAYRVLADQVEQTLLPWMHNASVAVQPSRPRVRLIAEEPAFRVLPRLTPDGDKHDYSQTRFKDFSSDYYGRLEPWRLSSPRQRFICEIMPARSIAIPPGISNASSSSYHNSVMEVWPPRTVPARHRIRSSSATFFRDRSHQPPRGMDLCSTAFRTRYWIASSFAPVHYLRVAEDVTSWAALEAPLRTPSPQRPYQGLWVGDYGGHGCEFLLLLHFTPAEARAMPRIRTTKERVLYEGVAAPGGPWTDDEADDSVDEIEDTQEGEPQPTQEAEIENTQEAGSNAAAVVESTSTAKGVGPLEDDTDKDNTASGRLHAVKLTGDPNVPRGQESWVAEDIGPRGFIRTADEPLFEGARVVRSKGHIASTGFINDRFIAAELFLVSSDTLAQYWPALGHISFYHRVDLDQLVHDCPH